MAIDGTLSALADGTRRDVVRRLARGRATVGELAAPYDISLPAFSKHLGVLAAAGLVSRRKVGRTVVVALRPEPLDELGDWLTDVTSYWTATLDRPEQLLEDR